MLKASLKLFSGSLVGKLAGALREVLLAALFGTSGVVAALRAAQSATLIPVNFFTADSLSAGFLPLYSRYSESDARRAAALFWWVAGLLLLASTIVFLALFYGAPYWVHLLVPGFKEEDRVRTIEFVRIMGMGVPFYIAGGLFSYLEMGNGAYRLASARATLQSVGMISGTLAAFLLGRPDLLAWGFTLAYVAFCGWGLLRVIGCGWAPRPTGLEYSDVRLIAGEFWRVVKPLMFLPVLLQGNIAVERAVASLLGVDASAALDYAKFITDTGVLLLAVPLGLAGLSAISRMKVDEAKVMLERLLPGLLILTIPLSVALAVHSRLIVATIYQRGHFDESSTELTQMILWGFGLGFWAQVISYLLIKALSAQLRNKEVFRYMALSLLAGALVNLSLYRMAGPVVLGLGGLVCGVVQLFLSARAMDLWALIKGRLVSLSLGAIGYALLALWVPKSGLAGICFASLLFVLYWGGFVMSVPILRRDVSPLWYKWKGLVA